MPSRPLDELRNADPLRWPHIATAEEKSAEQMRLLTELSKGQLPTDEGGFVVFGSLARREFTVGSDLDWTVMIDARADSNHLTIVHALKEILSAANFSPPGPTEVFGGLVFSHDLIHAIGGDEDSNKNMTRRLLLLLESAAVPGAHSQEVRERIIRGILHRYVLEDASFISEENRNHRIPRFLLNDVVRFWRTMAVDYASKYRARAGAKWALRNIKLRMSRKLLFVSGLLMCISWEIMHNKEVDRNADLIEHLLKWTERTPLDSLAAMVGQFAPDRASAIFDPYDAFLELISDSDKRAALERLLPTEAYKNEIFLEAREVANKFDASLISFLFDSDVQIKKLTQKYGVF